MLCRFYVNIMLLFSGRLSFFVKIICPLKAIVYRQLLFQVGKVIFSDIFEKKLRLWIWNPCSTPIILRLCLSWYTIYKTTDPKFLLPIKGQSILYHEQIICIAFIRKESSALHCPHISIDLGFWPFQVKRWGDPSDSAYLSEALAIVTIAIMTKTSLHHLNFPHFPKIPCCK